MTVIRMSLCTSAVERAGMHELIEGQKVSFEVVANLKTGKCPLTICAPPYLTCL
jgi:hypothetical protein